MIGYDLPIVINIEGIDYNIQSDFRVILDILIACADPDLNDYENPVCGFGYNPCTLL